MGEVLADRLDLGPGAALPGFALGGILLAMARGRLGHGAEMLLAASLGVFVLGLRLEAPAPHAPPEPVVLTLIGVPEFSGFNCRLPAYVHGSAPGRALVRAPVETCRWLPGQRMLAAVDLQPVPPDTNPGTRDLRRYWARRGIHRFGRVRESRIAPFGAPPGALRASLERLRRRVGDTLDSPEASEPASALLRALVTGDRSRLTGEARRPFERSGTAHLLAVSGLHIGWAFLLGRLVTLGALYPWPSVRVQRGRRRCALLVGLGVAGSYAALAGLSVPTLRAVSMAAAAAAALLAGRPAAGWNALAGAALLILSLDPASLFEPSFGLSFGAVTGILLWQPRGNVVGRLVGCTVGASLATAPLVVHLGLPLPALGLLANLLLVPWFTSVVVPLGLLCAILTLCAPSGAGLLIAGARAAASAGLEAARVLESQDLLPLVGTSAWTATVVLSAFTLRVGLRGECRLACVLGAAAAGLGLCASLPGPGRSIRGTAEILFLDVGHGDATLVRSRGVAWLVDAGPALGPVDSGRRIVLPVLRAEGVRSLEVLVLTHADGDHVGGAPSVLERVGVGEVWIPAAAAEDPDLARVRLAAAARGVPLRVVAAGEETRLGSWRARVLWPPRGYRPMHRNAGSLVLRLEGPGGCALLPGDAPLEVEGELAAGLAPCPVLKLGHHGSGSSTGHRWMAALDPELAVASASRFRAERSPGSVLRARLRAKGVTLYETAGFGAVRVCFTDPLVVLPYRVDRSSGSSSR